MPEQLDNDHHVPRAGQHLVGERPAAGTPAAEIEEIAWVDPLSRIELLLAPLTQEHVLPLYARPA